MNNSNLSIQDRTKKFAVRIINSYAELNKRNFDDAGKVLSKQFLRSGCSIGANCAEAKAAQSTRDFISKYEIALKECQEFIFWCEVFIEADLVRREKFSLLLQEADEIARILNSSIVKLKQKLLTSDF
jgi:four helix bundle protein